MISVVIPLYNKEDYIAQTLESVLAQTYAEFEVIIINDGSTDKSVYEVKKIDDKRIRIVCQHNAGVSAARNRGIEEAKFDLIAFLDADDLWKKDFLEAMINLQDKYKECSVFAVNYQIKSRDNNYSLPIINGMPGSFKKGVLKNYFKLASQSDPILCSSSIAVKKVAINYIDGFPVGIRAGEDLLTWARLAAHFDIAYTRQHKAIFCRWNSAEHNKPRLPDSHDKVAAALRQLLIEGDKDRIKGLGLYIACWHKIRVAIFLRLGMYSEVKDEFKKMTEFAEKDIKYFIYAFLIYSPNFIKTKTLKVIHYFNNMKRTFFKN